jgi:prephenate dehydrogenase
VAAVPVGSAVATIRDVLAAAPDDVTVTDVASTKRTLAESLDDSRFVPGHPVAGGETSGPDRATAELFDGATWFLTPGASADPARVELLERFVTALGARPIRRDAAEHDRLLALTSHLPHALANALMRVAAGQAGALESAGASFRGMTRVAGANTAVWTDIFLENGDLIAGAVAELRAELESLERALAGADRPYLEQSIADAQDGRNELMTYAYQAEAGQLHRIRIRVPDRPGVLARITQILGAASVNIEDFELRHVSPEYGGVLVILVVGAETAELARTLLRSEGYAAA